jgi:SNF2 family DNA or RNA helicase
VNVTNVNGLPRIYGTFSELGKLKSLILALPGDPTIVNQAKEYIEVSINVYLELLKLPEFTFEEDFEFSLHSQTVQTQYEKHELARTEVYRKLAHSECLTGSEYWDGLLDPHQGLAANCMATDGLLGMCVFDEQGTGKTITTLAAFDLLRSKGEVESLVVVAPKTLVENWKDESLKFITEWTPHIFVSSGDRSERFRKLNSSYDIYLLTYENLISDLESYKSIAKTKQLLLVADESFYVKNPEAVRSIAIMDFRKFCNKCFVLCGTPAPNRPTDLIHQFTLSDNGFSFGESGIQAYSDLDNFHKIESIVESRGVYLRRTKKVVLPDLPEKNYNIVELDLSPKQQTLYDEAKKELVLYLKSLDNKSFKRNLATYFQKRNALLQICIDPALIDPLYNETPCKFKYLTKSLEDLIGGQNKKIVLWSVYTKTIDRLVKDFAKYGPARIDGKIVKVSDRKQMVDRFQNDENCKIFIGNPAAAGAGITLHKASTAIYVSYSSQAAHYMQSLDRIHRRGQMAEEVDYFFLVGKGTIESKEIKRLLEKQERQNSLLGDPEEETIELAKIIAELDND